MSMLRFLVALPALLVAMTIKLEFPAVIGIPVIAPVDVFILRLPGRLPPAKAQVIGFVPVTVRVWLYAIPTVPIGNEVMVIFGAPVALLITISKFFKVEPAILNALIITVWVSATFGMPEITPDKLLRLKPVGNLPNSTIHIIGDVPVALRVRS